MPKTKSISRKSSARNMRKSKSNYGVVHEGVASTEKKGKSKKKEALCPGKEKFIDSVDLAPSVFRDLVAKRARAYDPDTDFPLDPAHMKDPEKNRRDQEALILEKVSEEADFLPVSFLSKGTNRSRSVCRIRTPRSLGTGFLITSSLIMTNNHVIKNTDVAQESVAEFQFEGEETPIVVAIKPERFFRTDARLDYTIVAVESTGLDGIAPIRLTQNPALATRHERVNIIQHPRGRKKEVALHDNKVTRVRAEVIKYSTDTEPGSSGSPVFNNNWDLVALHHAGVNNDDGTATNEGIRISAIVDHILGRRRAPNTESMRRIEKELFTSLANSRSMLGFFGNAGLDTSDLEIQINGFQGTPAFADVGFWNIEHFNNDIDDQRVSDVADVIENLSLDAVGLTEVQEGAMNRLLGELNRRGLRYGFVLRNTRGRQDLAVLFDTDTTTVELRSDLEEANRSLLRARTANGQTAFPRTPLFAECTVAQGDDEVKFIMIVVHLKAFGDVESRARRRLAAEKLGEIIQNIRNEVDLPVVLGGDFNEELNNDVLSGVTDSPDLFPLTADDAQNGAASFVGRRFSSLIDHIIVSRDARLGDIAGDDAAIVRLDRSVDGFADDVSDHVPVVFRMIIRDEPIVQQPAPREQPVVIDPLTGQPGSVVIDIPDGVSTIEVEFS